MSKTKKELQDEIRIYRRLANSTNRGMARIKNEELRDMKIQFKNIQNAVGKLQKENKKLKGKIEVIIEKGNDYYFAHCDKYDGCVVEGKTIIETKKNFKDAFISYLMSMLKHNEYFKFTRRNPKRNI